MNNWNREEAKRDFRQNEIRILRDQWFQQDLREAEMKSQLDRLAPLPNPHPRQLFKNDLTRQNRQQIQINLDFQRMEAERKATEFKRRMRVQQIESLQKIWLEQDMREVKAQAEAQRIFRELSGLKQPFS